MCYAMNALENYDSDRQQLKTLEEMQLEVHENNVDKGWFDRNRTFGDDVALLHTEVSEMFEAHRRWGIDDATKAGNITDLGDLPKPEGVGSEVADVFIRLLDTCERHGVNLRAEYERKLAYNRTRPYRHGNKVA